VTVRTRKRVLEFIRSPEPTAYRVRDPAMGQEVYVRCAMDALLYPVLAGREVELTASPPGVANALELTVGPEGAESWPEGWVLVYPDLPIESEDFERIARERCPLVHLFPDRSSLERWLSGLPPALQERVRVLSLEEAFAWARRRAESWPEGG